MRILLGPFGTEYHDEIRRWYARAGDETLAYTPDDLTLEAVLARCPADWRPDVLVHWSLEYNPVPVGLEKADFLTVGVFGDWNLGARAARCVGGVFDTLLADSAGGELLRRAGFKSIRYGRLWGYNPNLHRRLPDVERDIDILMLGNFNHAIHRERARWLARVARLSRKHRVVLTGGVYGEEYTRLMNRAKIVFNRSVGGGINMRAYEATVCGALLFNERDNAEIRDLFTDREHCVLYGDDDLEELLDYYLAPENAAERERIAQAGWERVQTHDDRSRFRNLLDQIEPMVRERVTGGEGRSFCALPSAERELTRLTQWLLSGRAENLPQIHARLSTLGETWTNGDSSPFAPIPIQAQAGNLHAAVLGEWALRSPDPQRKGLFQEALGRAEAVLQSVPNYTLAWCNLGFLALAAGQMEAGEAVLREALNRLKSPELTAAQLRGVYFPRQFEPFDIEAEWIAGTWEPDSAAWLAALRDALSARILTTLAYVALERGAFGATVAYGEQAVALAPGWGAAQSHLGRAYRARGQDERAMAAFRQAIDAAPFQLEAWRNLAELLLEAGRAPEAAALMDDLTAILDGCPFYNPIRAPLDQLAAKAQRKAAPQAETKRLLALPDWNAPEQWQPLLRAYVERYRPGDPVTLLLPVSAEHPPAETILTAVSAFLSDTLGLSPDAIPDVILLTEAVAPDGTVDGKPIADAVITLTEKNESEPARLMRLPTLSLAQLAA